MRKSSELVIVKNCSRIKNLGKKKNPDDDDCHLFTCLISPNSCSLFPTPLSSAYPTVCDSQCPPASPDPVPPAPSLPQHDGDASRLEAQFVHQVYEEIASHFSSTRHSPWPRVRDFLLALPTGALLADVGCGNGKYLGINPEVMSVSEQDIL